MKKIFKYEMEFMDLPEVEMPVGAEILTVDKQGDSMEPVYGDPKLFVWAIVEEDETKTEVRRFRISGTGHPLGDFNLKHINTIQIFGGTQIYHIFE